MSSVAGWQSPPVRPKDCRTANPGRAFGTPSETAVVGWLRPDWSRLSRLLLRIPAMDMASFSFLFPAAVELTQVLHRCPAVLSHPRSCPVPRKRIIVRLGAWGSTSYPSASGGGAAGLALQRTGQVWFAAAKPTQFIRVCIFLATVAAKNSSYRHGQGQYR